MGKFILKRLGQMILVLIAVSILIFAMVRITPSDPISSMTKGKTISPEARQELVAMGGLNYSDQFREGDLRDARNLSARRWPYISTRRGREKQKDYAGVSALTAWGKLVAVPALATPWSASFHQL